MAVLHVCVARNLAESAFSQSFEEPEEGVEGGQRFAHDCRASGPGTRTQLGRESTIQGKEHKKYEFGNKVPIIRSATGLILGACSLRNEYDVHTIRKSLEQVQRLTGKRVKQLAGDRGYRGKSEVNRTQIPISGRPKATGSYCQRCKKHKLFCKRAAIEPTIGHLKPDYRLGRNFYKGGARALVVGRFIVQQFGSVFRQQLAGVCSKRSQEQASARRSCGLPIRPRPIEKSSDHAW